MMPLNHILRKCTGGYKLRRLQKKKKNQPLNVHGRIKLFAKNEKELKILIQAVTKHSNEVGMEFGKEKCVKLIIKKKSKHSEKIKITNT